MRNHINVTLIFQDQSVDVRIPMKIEVRRLIREFDRIFQYKKERTKYQLRVLNKGLVLDEGKVLSRYPITSGDIIEIKEI